MKFVEGTQLGLESLPVPPTKCATSFEQKLSKVNIYIFRNSLKGWIASSHYYLLLN